MSFEVIAGKYEHDGSLNYKYSEDFETIEAALQAYERVKSYPWAHVCYRSDQFIYSITAHKHMKAVECEDKVVRYFPCDGDGNLTPN